MWGIPPQVLPCSFDTNPKLRLALCYSFAKQSLWYTTLSHTLVHSIYQHKTYLHDLTIRQLKMDFQVRKMVLCRAITMRNTALPKIIRIEDEDLTSSTRIRYVGHKLIQKGKQLMMVVKIGKPKILFSWEWGWVDHQANTTTWGSKYKMMYVCLQISPIRKLLLAN